MNLKDLKIYREFYESCYYVTYRGVYFRFTFDKIEEIFFLDIDEYNSIVYNSVFEETDLSKDDCKKIINKIKNIERLRKINSI